MAFCKSCGAYIPDGQSTCLACGYQEAKANSNTQTAGQTYSQDNEEMKARLEEQRQRQQEKNRRWAEQEYERRRQQEENRRWAEEEYARRQAERERQAQSYVNRPSAAGSTAGAAEGNRALAAISYLSVLFAVPYLFAPQDEYARYHARQGLKLFVFSILADVLGGLTGIGWLVSLFRLYLIYKGMSNALNGRKEPLPYIGTIGEQ